MRSAWSAARRLRLSQQLTGAPIRGAVIKPGGMRPWQIALARSGVSATVLPISSAVGTPLTGLRPSRGWLQRERDGATKPQIQRRGIGSSCDCLPSLRRSTSSSTGQPLDAETRARTGTRFGRDLPDVRIHTDTSAAAPAEAAGARAYTVGHRVLFGAGEYFPGTAEGEQLLAHELAHMLQQRVRWQQGGAAGGGDSVRSVEAAAREASRQVTSGTAVVPVRGTAAPGSLARTRSRRSITTRPETSRQRSRKSWERLPLLPCGIRRRPAGSRGCHTEPGARSTPGPRAAAAQSGGLPGRPPARAHPQRRRERGEPGCEVGEQDEVRSGREGRYATASAAKRGAAFGKSCQSANNHV
jgi:hypothetical protein